MVLKKLFKIQNLVLVCIIIGLNCSCTQKKNQTMPANETEPKATPQPKSDGITFYKAKWDGWGHGDGNGGCEGWGLCHFECSTPAWGLKVGMTDRLRRV